MKKRLLAVLFVSTLVSQVALAKDHCFTLLVLGKVNNEDGTQSRISVLGKNGAVKDGKNFGTITVSDEDQKSYGFYVSRPVKGVYEFGFTNSAGESTKVVGRELETDNLKISIKPIQCHLSGLGL